MTKTQEIQQTQEVQDIELIKVQNKKELIGLYDAKLLKPSIYTPSYMVGFVNDIQKYVLIVHVFSDPFSVLNDPYILKGETTVKDYEDALEFSPSLTSYYRVFEFTETELSFKLYSSELGNDGDQWSEKFYTLDLLKLTVSSRKNSTDNAGE